MKMIPVLYPILGKIAIDEKFINRLQRNTKMQEKFTQILFQHAGRVEKVKSDKLNICKFYKMGGTRLKIATVKSGDMPKTDVTILKSSY